MSAFFLSRGYLVLTCGFVFVVIFAFYYGRWSGAVNARAEVKARTVEKVIAVKEKQDEVRNHRPDDERLIDSLLSGQF